MEETPDLLSCLKINREHKAEAVYERMLFKKLGPGNKVWFLLRAELDSKRAPDMCLGDCRLGRRIEGQEVTWKLAAP